MYLLNTARRTTTITTQSRMFFVKSFKGRTSRQTEGSTLRSNLHYQELHSQQIQLGAAGPRGLGLVQLHLGVPAAGRGEQLLESRALEHLDQGGPAGLQDTLGQV